MKNRVYANMMLENEGLSCFSHTLEGPLLVLLASCVLPKGSPFESHNKDLFLTGLNEQHPLGCKWGHICRCIKEKTLYSMCVLVRTALQSLTATMPPTRCLLFLLISLMNSKQLQSMVCSLGMSRAGTR